MNSRMLGKKNFSNVNFPVSRRIGQSTRHSVRGTKDGQKQSIEEQIKKCREDPYVTVSTYFIENKETILKMLEARF